MCAERGRPAMILAAALTTGYRQRRKYTGIEAFIPGCLFSFPGIRELISSFLGIGTVTGNPEEITLLG